MLQQSVQSDNYRFNIRFTSIPTTGSASQGGERGCNYAVSGRSRKLYIGTLPNRIDHQSSIPVPHMYAYDASVDNEVRFPWILMSFIEATPANERWPSLTAEQKSQVVRQLAVFTSEVASHRFSNIGCLTNERSTGGEPEVGPMTTIDQAYNDPLNGPGPHSNSYGWLETRLARIIRYDVDATPDPEHFEDEDDLVDARDRAANIVAFTPKIRGVLPHLFDANADEPAIMSAHDLHGGNILLAENGDIARLIDWEFTATKPMWYACQPPKFLEYGNQYFRPKEDYAGEPNPYYVREMVAFDMYTRYRQEFLDNMKAMSPEWEGIYQAAQAEREFEHLFGDLRIGFAGGVDDIEWLEFLLEDLETRGAWNVAKPVAIDNYESRYPDPFAAVETP